MSETDRGWSSQGAYGCLLSPGDPDQKMTWTGELLGIFCGRTKKGCYHAELTATRRSEAGSALTEIAAEICLPSLHHMETYLAMWVALPDVDVDNPTRCKVGIIEGLPEIHAIAQQQRDADARRRILG